MNTFFKRFLRQGHQVLSSQQAYQLWSATYRAEPHNVLMAIEQDAMLSLLPSLAGRRVLDLACGTGRYSRLAVEQNARWSIGVDNSIAMLHQAAGVPVSCASSDALPVAAAAVDVVLCGLALGHLADLQPSLNEISRVLTPDGMALISDFHPFQYLAGHRRTFSAKGTVYEVQHYPHLYADYHQAAAAAGLQITAVREPEYDQMPVVLVLKFEKVRPA